MKPTPNRHEKLEHFIQQTLRDLPNRRAPHTLERRVLAEIARRAALPWWRKSYAYWPAPVRAAFFVGSAAIAALVVAGIFTLTRGSAGTETLGQIAAQLGGIRSFFETVFDKIVMIVRAIPPLWLYGGIALIASCYLTLIGIGAVAYRTLRAHR
jgi:hypothetical protein